MRKSLWLIPFIFIAVLSGCSQSQDSEWELVWSDEFEHEGLPDQAKWGYEVGYIRNNELQYYTEKRLENARVEDGILIIEARRDNWQGHEYTSASLRTRNTATWQYGRIEVKARLPTGTGMWPAVWMLGMNIDEVGWPECGEIDIMENVGFEPDRIHANIHTEAYNHVKGTNKGNSIVVSAPYDNYHLYAIEWTADKIGFFVDEQQYFAFENEGAGDAVWPFDQPFYLIINAAIGGGWGGQQGVDDSIFPQQYFVEYVRVYKQR
ncbi:MAG TPA: glycoside hydrolase family 16 protein [bacterium]|nr:glycoside hydrolase family 16 protein [bacterium]